MKSLGLRQQSLFRFYARRIVHAGIRRANRLALFFIMETDTLSALFRHNVLIISRQGRKHLAVQLIFLTARINCGVRTF